VSTAATVGVSESAESTSAWLALGGLIQAAVNGALAGAIAGALAGGVGGRIAMRITAIMATDAEQGALTDAGERVGDITFEGTLALIFFGGIFSGVLGGFVFAATSRWFRDAGRATGVLFGVFLLATLGWGVIEGDNFDFATFGAVTANLAMFAAIFLLFGVLVAPLYDWIRSSFPRPSLTVGGLAVLPAYALGLLMTAGLLGAVAAGFGAEGSKRWFFTIVPAYLILAMPLAAILIGRRRRFDRVSELKDDPLAIAAALAVIILPVVVGVALDAQALSEILGDAY